MSSISERLQSVNLTRTRIAIAVVASAVTGYVIYDWLTHPESWYTITITRGSPGLHRSNAIRRTSHHRNPHDHQHGRGGRDQGARARRRAAPSPSAASSDSVPGDENVNLASANLDNGVASGPDSDRQPLALATPAAENDRGVVADDGSLAPDAAPTVDSGADAATGTGVGASEQSRAATGGETGRTLNDAAVAEIVGAPPTVAAADDDDWWNDPSQIPPQRAGQNIVQLLFRVSEDNARRNAYEHRGCACNACGTVPIRGVRYRCANCADFDLCETCEAQGLHYKTHVFYKVRVPAPPFCPRQIQPVWYPGDPESCLRSLPRSLMARLSKETGLERPELEAFWEQWTFMANTEWREDPDELYLAMDRKTFERCLVPSGGYRHAAPNLIHDRMFAFYDTNNDDLIGFREFLHGLSYRKRKDKLKKIFDGYDIDEDGYVSRKDFLRMFRAYYVLYKQMHRDTLEAVEDQVMSSTEAQQLVTSRQPLSSLFGREGRVPPANSRLAGEGKMVLDNGEVEVIDGRTSVVVEDKPDTAPRQQILYSLEFPSKAYARALLRPPASIEELRQHLAGTRTTVDEALAVPEQRDGSEAGHSDAENRDVNATGESATASRAANQTNGESSSAAAAAGDTHADEQPERWVGWEEDIKAETIMARRRLHDRWRRRQFYLDEEEGGLPPDDWQDEEDVLVHANGAAAENAKEPIQPYANNSVLSPRSRSSSKVRFAEETDDFETRSNPSTSSRSVPERWGGIDIPDAEKDAGKEILYQVTQQAFNELLDTIFRAKETLAIHAANTRAERAKNRHLYADLDLSAEGKDEEKLDDDALIDTVLRDTVTIPNADDDEDDDEDEAEANGEEVPTVSTDVYAEPVAHNDVDDTPRDPTMPQFRPNSIDDVRVTTSITCTSSLVPEGEASSVADKSVSSAAATGATRADNARQQNQSTEMTPGSKKRKGRREPKAPRYSRQTLRMWQRLDEAEREAAERGGWGRLSFAEFEMICKGEENSGNRLDYLGSWIDFCIP